MHVSRRTTCALLKVQEAWTYSLGAPFCSAGAGRSRLIGDSGSWHCRMTRRFNVTQVHSFVIASLKRNHVHVGMYKGIRV